MRPALQRYIFSIISGFYGFGTTLKVYDALQLMWNNIKAKKVLQRFYKL